MKIIRGSCQICLQIKDCTKYGELEVENSDKHIELWLCEECTKMGSVYPKDLLG
jgi:heterodisulfide reductase subunit A-like polyferredoxin